MSVVCICVVGRKTGEVLGVIDRGNNSVVTLLNYILFTILPTIADILIAIVYFVFAFNLYFGLIVFGCLSAYVAATITISEWRTKFRREVNRLDNASRTKVLIAGNRARYSHTYAHTHKHTI